MQGPGSPGALFEPQADVYAKSRPTYPKSIYDIVFKFARLPQKELAVDAGGEVLAQQTSLLERPCFCLVAHIIPPQAPYIAGSKCPA